MAWYNPKQVSFDTDSGIISASGAVGKALWDIYKENTRYNQAQAELDEKIRANNANLEQKRAEFDYTKALRDKQYNLSVDKFNADLAYKNANLNQQRDYQNKNLALQMARLNSSNNNANLDNPLEVELKFQALNGQMPQDYANLNPNEQLEYKKAFVNTYTNPQISKFVSAQNQTDPLKNLPAKMTDKLGDTSAILEMLSGYSKMFKENQAQQTGLFDAITAPLAHKAGLASSKNAYLHELAKSISEKDRAMTKGGAKYVLNNTYDQIKPSAIFADNKYAAIASLSQKHLQTIKEQADLLYRQGNYRASEYLQNQYKELLDSFPDEVRKLIVKTNNQPNLEKQTDRKSKWEAKINNQSNLEQNRPQQDIDYSDLDELGVLYEPF